MGHKKKLAVFISGRGSNMTAIARACENGVLSDLAEMALVFSNKPEAEGLATAKDRNIATESIFSKGLNRREFDRQVIDLLKDYELDYVVLAGFMRRLSPVFIRAYAGKIINIHPADTRVHQGLDAYKWAFDNNLKETVLTVHYVDEGLDTGVIIAQQKVNISTATTLEEVERMGLAVEHQFYSEVLADLITSNNY